MVDYKKILEQLKKVNFDSAIVSFYVVKRSLYERNASYSIKRVQLEEKLMQKFRDIVLDKLSSANEVIPYDFNTADQDQDFLAIDIYETDVQEILRSLETSQEQVAKYDELLGTWVYIIQITTPDEQEKLFAVRKVSDVWSTKKVNSWVNLFYHECMLRDLEEKKIFKIDGKLDFFVYNNSIFIADKKAFESAMNFRQGMLNNRDEIVDEISSLGICENPNELKEIIGDNMKLLRRLSQVKKAGYYKDPEYLKNARKVCCDENWDISFSETGKIEIRKDNIDTILRVLNNDRLKSPINAEKFDVDVKHKL